MATAAKKSPQAPTQYVILAEREGAWYEVDSKVGRKGEEAIRQYTHVKGDEHKPGTFKAVPVSTWDSEGNNVEIATDTKVVSTFSKPKSSRNGAAAVAVKA